MAFTSSSSAPRLSICDGSGRQCIRSLRPVLPARNQQRARHTTAMVLPELTDAAIATSTSLLPGAHAALDVVGDALRLFAHPASLPISQMSIQQESVDAARNLAAVYEKVVSLSGDNDAVADALDSVEQEQLSVAASLRSATLGLTAGLPGFLVPLITTVGEDLASLAALQPRLPTVLRIAVSHPGLHNWHTHIPPHFASADAHINHT